MLLETKLIGNLGSDAEIKTFDGGTSVISFNVAHTEKWKKGDEWQSKTTWVTCKYWRTAAQGVAIAQYLKKGKLVYVSGKPEARAWLKSEDNSPQAALELNVGQVQLLSKNEEGTTASAPAATSAGSSSVNSKPGEDDDLPF